MGQKKEISLSLNQMLFLRTFPQHSVKTFCSLEAATMRCDWWDIVPKQISQSEKKRALSVHDKQGTSLNLASYTLLFHFENFI